MFSTNPQLAAAVRSRLIDALGPHVLDDEDLLVVGMKGDRAVLQGCVHTWDQHEALERAALDTPGVASVDNRLALLVNAQLSES